MKSSVSAAEHKGTAPKALYDIVNSRINSRKPTVINTNLTHEELRQRYADRITSRLLGEYRPLVFSGCDVRLQKLSR